MKKTLRSLLFINLFFLQSYLIRFNIGGFPTNLQEILIGLNFIPLFVLIVKKEIKLKFPKILAIFLVLFITGSLSAQIYDLRFFLSYWKFFIFASTLIFIFIHTLQTEQQKEEGLKYYTYGVIAFGLFSIIFNLSGHNVTFDHRLTGPLDSAVYLGVYIVPALLFNFTKFINTLKKPYFKNRYLIFTILLGILLLLTKSMGAITAASAVSFIFLLKKFGKKLFDSKLKILILSILFIALSSVVFYTKILPTINTTWSSLDERNEIYITSKYLLKESKNFIFGLGPAQFQYHYENNVEKAINNKALDYKVLQPHNIFFLFIFNYGILGLSTLFVLIFYTAKTIIRNKADSFKLVSGIIVCYFFIHGLLDTPFMKNDLLFLFLLFLEEEI
ncbi:MAG: O-antigen ligase family protein [Candidatus Gracilibacteria bacterium]|jgi:hypothetical protein|nr:O-antigen ligase family protein [Candidatus Gracilibacteria bacterium]